MTPPASRDLEQLSAYLDGQLSQADGARLESHIQTDPELRSIYEGLRQTRSLLRQLPARRAPRNFRLTPQMVGIKPSMPRSFPIFRLASVLASILLLIGYAINLSSVTSMAAAPTSMAYDTYQAPAGAAAATAPAPAAEPTQSFAPKMAPTAAPETSLAQQDALSTSTPEANRNMTNPSAETMPLDIQNAAPFAYQAPTLPIQPGWLFGLLGLAVVSGASAFVIRIRAEEQKPTIRDIILTTLALVVTLLLALGIYWMSVR